MVDKRRSPGAVVVPLFGNRLLAVADIHVGRAGVAQVLRIERAVSIQFLGIAHTDGVARLAVGHQRHPARHVLAEVDDVGVGLAGQGLQFLPLYGAGDGLGRLHQSVIVLHQHARRHLSAQLTGGDVGALGLEPLAVVVAHLGPAGHLHAGVVLLAVVFVVRADGTVGRHLPALVVGLQALGGAVVILHDDVDAALGQSEDGYLVGLVLLHGEVAAVAEDDAEADGSRPSRRSRPSSPSSPTPGPSPVGRGVVGESLGDVVGVVVDGFAVVAGDGGEHVATDALTVDVELVKTQSGHEGGGTLDLCLLQFKLFAQVAGGHSGVETTLLAGLQTLQSYPVALPLRLVEQTGAEVVGVVIPAGLALVGLHADVPPTVTVAAQRLAGVGNPQLLVALHPARVPEVAFTGFHLLVRRGNDNLIGRLAHVLVLIVVTCYPREPGLVGVDA